MPLGFVDNPVPLLRCQPGIYGHGDLIALGYGVNDCGRADDAIAGRKNTRKCSVKGVADFNSRSPFRFNAVVLHPIKIGHLANGRDKQIAA